MHPRACIVCDDDATLDLRVRTVRCVAQAIALFIQHAHALDSYFKGLEEVHNELLGDRPEKIMLGATAPN